MAISLVNLAVATNISGATLSAANLTVPSGAMVIVGVSECNATAGSGSVADGVNSYSLISSVLVPVILGTVRAQFFYAFNASLNAGAITYTKRVSGATTAMSLCYATGLLQTGNPLVASQASSTTGVVTVATATISCHTSNFLVAVEGFHLRAFSSFLSGWAQPPNTAVATLACVGGAWILCTTNTQLYSSTLQTAQPWGLIIAEFTGFVSAPALKPHLLGLMGVGI